MMRCVIYIKPRSEIFYLTQKIICKLSSRIFVATLRQPQEFFFVFASCQSDV